MNSETNKLSLKPISDLLDYKFFVPSYQRGYRWTDVEVTALLDDIYEFIQDNEKSDKTVFYCLQPLIVYLQDGKYHVIDGQQRLTTIYIILSYLKKFVELLRKPTFKISYETRPDSEIYLQNIDGNAADENVDYYHINEAHKAVEKWFLEREGSVEFKIASTILASDTDGKNVKFIWYEINPEDSIDVFTRINIGKIPLTNAELIKALFVRDRNYRVNEMAKKVAITTEWDEIEKKLSDSKFWYFLSNLEQNSSFDNKIEYLLDIISKKNKESEKLHTFFYFNNLIEEEKGKENFDIDNIWILIKDKFQILEEWFNDHALYHYIGYLLTSGFSISDILKSSKGKDKLSFIEDIRKKIERHFSTINIDELSYEKNSEKALIKKTLLLFNIETILQSKKSHIRFPFDRYKTEAWDIEHINPQNPFDKIECYKEWCLDTLEYLTGENIAAEKVQIENDEYEEYCELLTYNLEEDEKIIVEKIVDILNDKDNYRPKTEELAQNLYLKYKGTESENNNHISNLTLLDAVTNRSYGNSLFPIKRNTIIKNDRSGIFVPICTKNVFLKYYSKKLSDVMFWKESDAKAYFENINEVLSNYLTVKN